MFVRTNSRKSGHFIQVYIREALGSVLGGLVVSFLYIQWFTIFQSLLITSLLAALILLFIHRKLVFLLIVAALISGLVLLFTTSLERRLKTVSMAGNEVTLTITGNLMQGTSFEGEDTIRVLWK